MKWIAVFIFVFMSTYTAALDANAQASDITSSQKDGMVHSSDDNEILTAVDVIKLMYDGSSEADIAKSLSQQRGFDREASLKKGNTDEDIIKYLVMDGKPVNKVIDDNQALRHKTEGNMYYYKERQYDRAAKEYTLAMKYSVDQYELYKLRADSYKQYLRIELDPASRRSSAEKAKQVMYDRSKMLLCNAIYSDYAKALSLNDKTISDITLELNVRQNNMRRGQIDYDKNEKIDPYHYKAARQTLDVRLIRKLNRSLMAVKQASLDIKMAISDYTMVCGEEDSARREFIKIDQDQK